MTNPSPACLLLVALESSSAAVSSSLSSARSRETRAGEEFTSAAVTWLVPPSGPIWLEVDVVLLLEEVVEGGEGRGLKKHVYNKQERRTTSRSFIIISIT